VEADDPTLEAKRQELFERIKKMDEVMVTVLKNHIGLEQFMSEYLEASGKEPEDFGFYEKVEECKELNPPEVEAAIWDVVYAANELRNKIAHTFEQAKIKAKMDALRAAYLAAVTEQQRKGANATGAGPGLHRAAGNDYGGYLQICDRGKQPAIELVRRKTPVRRRRVRHAIRTAHQSGVIGAGMVASTGSRAGSSGPAAVDISTGCSLTTFGRTRRIDVPISAGRERMPPIRAGDTITIWWMRGDTNPLVGVRLSLLSKSIRMALPLKSARLHDPRDW
jgi:hypothetical protein